MSINSLGSNIAAQSASLNISRNSNELSSSISRLSSGNRITRPSDDVAALSVGTKLQSQLSGMRSAMANTAQGTSMMQVASSGINEIIDILGQQKSLAVQAQSGSLTASERSFLNQEFQSLAAEIDRIAGTTKFGEVSLLNGGLGTPFSLFSTDAAAANFDPSSADISNGTAAASTVAIQAFDVTNGTLRNGTGAAGRLDIVDSGDVLLSNAAYGDVNNSIHGQFSSFDITDVTHGVSGTLTATINGVDFTGNFAHNATAVTVSNGNSYIRLGTTALNISDVANTALSKGQITTDFSDTTILRTGVVSGVNFTDTRLEDAVGTGVVPLATLRSDDNSGSINIDNFQYVGNSGADTNVLSVEINGETFSATGVDDTIDDGVATILAFENGKGEALLINIAGLTSGSNTAIANIRTDETDRANFIDALNTGFSKAGGGLTFDVSGDPAGDTISVTLDSAATSSLYGGQTLDINSTGTAATTAAAIDTAIAAANAIQADIGAIQSRFDYASSELESRILGIDEARGSLLDTDITAESTAFASAQVRLQAGVAALAQANTLQSAMLDILKSN